jgi:hypothetical protein
MMIRAVLLRLIEALQGRIFSNVTILLVLVVVDDDDMLKRGEREFWMIMKYVDHRMINNNAALLGLRNVIADYYYY